MEKAVPGIIGLVVGVVAAYFLIPAKVVEVEKVVEKRVEVEKAAPVANTTENVKKKEK